MPSIVEPVPIHLDRLRHIRLDNRAIFTAELELSRLWSKKTSLFSVLSTTDSLGLNDLSILLWAGLRHEDPTLTLEQTQDLIDMRELPALITAVLQAWNNATVPAEPQASSDGGPSSPFPNGSPGVVSGPIAVSN